MDGGEHKLAYLTVEEDTEELEFLVGITQSVAMGKEEYLSVYLCCERLLVQYHSTFFLQVVEGPDVVIACEVVYLHTHIREFRQFAEETGISTRHDILELIPEVEHVAKEIDGGSLVLDAVEKPDQPALMHSAMVDGKGAQMSVRKEIYILHPIFQFFNLSIFNLQSSIFNLQSTQTPAPLSPLRSSYSDPKSVRKRG